jgi:hypothetical protein
MSAQDPPSIGELHRPTAAAAFGIDLHWLPMRMAASPGGNRQATSPCHSVIFGFTATYYQQEIMRDYPAVDFIVCGDSTEEPLRLLMQAIKSGGDYRSVPNLIWRDEQGQVTVNSISYRPATLDYVHFDYSHFVKMTLKYHDPSGYLPI